MACSSPGAKISPRASKPPGARSSASCMHCSGPFCRLAWTMATVAGRRRDSYSVSAAATEGAFPERHQGLRRLGWPGSPRWTRWDTWMGRVPEERDGAFAPAGKRIPVHHGELKHLLGLGDQGRHIEPGEMPARELPGRARPIHGLIPVFPIPGPGPTQLAIQLIRWRPSPQGGSMG